MHFSRWSTLGASAAIALAVPTVAFADRPGTPNGESAHQCNGLGDFPQVCVTFNNTATELVGFDIEFTADGVKIDGAADDHPHRRPTPGHRPQAVDIYERPWSSPHCLGPGCQARQPLEIFSPARRSFMYGSLSGEKAEGRTGDNDKNDMYIPPRGFRVVNLDYGVTYCFRFKARRMSDDMVSENWSNWACATTGGPPPKPLPPPAVTTDYTPGGVDWRIVPPSVVIKWGKSLNAASYIVGRPPVRQLNNGTIELYSQLQVKAGEFAVTDPLSGSDAPQDLTNPSIVYAVCAINVSGYACTTHTTFVPPGDSVQKPSRPIDVTIPAQPSHDANRPVPTDLPATNADQVGRPSGGLGTGMASAGGQDRARSTACAPGYVWRVARAEDVVCVTPGARGRIRQENTNGPRHVNATGAYGPNTCDAGYVWRDAFDGDVVCVTPEGRALARQENAEGPSHLADQGEVFRAPH
jgi:hypothetical protein